MGLFNGYLKEGKGVDPDAPQKRSFFRFFDIFFRKLWHFAKANLLYSVALIPTFIVVYFISLVIASVLLPEVTAVNLIVALFIANMYVSIWGAGPATAGITYIMRNFAREEHAWIWSDFKDNVKSNFKQSIIVFLIDLVAIVMFYVAIAVYSQQTGFIGSLRFVVYAIIFVYSVMHMYIYPMMVTFELPLKDLYKNALLFAFAGLPSNILVTAVLIGLHLVLPIYLFLVNGQWGVGFMLVLLMLEVCITQAFSAFLVNFNAYPKIKKYMLDVIENKGENSNVGENS